MIARVTDGPHRRYGMLIESDGPGGAEQVVAHLAERLTLRGHEVVIFVPKDGEGWVRTRVRGTGIGVEELPLGGPLSPGGILALVGALRRARVDLLHTHEFGQALPGAVAARLAGVPHIITMHGGRYFAERARRRAALRLAVALSDGCTAVSAPLADDLRETLRLATEAVTVLPNGTREITAHANGTRQELGLPAEARLLLAVGNLYPVKGHRYLIDAIARLSDRLPHLHLAIAGRGTEGERLAAQADHAGVGERVHLLGLRDDIGSLLASADLFVQPSLAEGLPMAVLEAMFAARPVIASAVGEIPTVLEAGSCGRLVPPGDPEELALAIEEVLAIPDGGRELGHRARARARCEYTVDRMVDRYEEIYDRALAQRGRR